PVVAWTVVAAVVIDVGASIGPAIVVDLSGTIRSAVVADLGGTVTAIVTNLGATVTAVVAWLGGTIAVVISDLGLAVTALNLGRRQRAVGTDCLDLNALAPVQRAQTADAVEPRVASDMDRQQAVAVLAVSHRECMRGAIDGDDRA